MGVVNGNETSYCTVYILLLNSFGYSNVIALLPLTIDRAVAVILPLRHGSIITHKTCAIMLLSVWLSILIVLINYLVDFKSGTVAIKYSMKYHRCIMIGKTYDMENIFLFILPFLLILFMYGIMLFVIVRKKRSCGRFLLLSTGIIGSNMMCFTPTIITNLGAINMSYVATQLLYVTVWYMNGIFNPLIYFLSHPKTKKYFMSRFVLTKAKVGSDAGLQHNTHGTPLNDGKK